MIKRCSKILLGLLVLLLVPTIANADSAMYCDASRAYTVRKSGSTWVSGYKMNLYDTTTDGVAGLKTYCMSPGKQGGAYLGPVTYYCERVVDPSNDTGDMRQAYDVAITKAYQTLLNRGLATTSEDSRVIGELIFRWLSFNYGQGDADHNLSTWRETLDRFTMGADGMPKRAYWDTSDPRVNIALQIFGEAQSAGNLILEGYKYQDLLPTGPGDTNAVIWGDDYTNIVDVKQEGDAEIYTIGITATNDVPAEIYWDKFKGGCENSTVTCTSTASGSGNQGQVIITVRKNADYNGQSYEIYFDSAYYDIRSASSNILLLQPVGLTSQGKVAQKMLVAVDGNVNLHHDGGGGRTWTSRRYPVYTDRCERQADGSFDYITYKNGNEQSRQKVTTEDDMIKYSCPTYCTLRADSVRTDEQYGWADQSHYGKLDYGNKYFFNRDDYSKYCGSTCRQENGKNYCGSQYFAEHPEAENDECKDEEYQKYCDPGKGNSCKHDDTGYYDKNGNKTNQAGYFRDCCDQLDPNSEDYQKYCGCGNPEIEFQNSCQEFNVDDEIESHVADNLETSKLKYCLFSPNTNNDYAGNSYEMKDNQNINSNPYCKVSCVERYDFKLPNAEYTESGGYFTLETTVTGTRKCYINARDDYDYNGIDYDKFTLDLKEAADKLAEAYSEYNKLNTALQHETSRTVYADSHYEYSYSCGEDGKDTCYGCGDISNDCSTEHWYNTAYTYTRYTASLTGSGRDISINLVPGTGSKPEEAWNIGEVQDGACNSGSCSVTEAGSQSGLEAKIKAGDGSGSMDYWQEQITVWNKKIEDIFALYDQCTNGWENNFKFEPEIQFEYDEPYQNMDGFNKKFEQISKEESSSDQYCVGPASDEYKCSTNTTTSAGTYVQHYFTCTTAGCQAATRNISSAAYIVKEQTATATYRPKNHFSVYTPSGTIALNKDQYVLYTGLCSDDECLPIALNTPTGVFNFKFRYSKIGQYNDNNQTGRLMGDGKSVYSAATNLQEGGYVCHYINNCPQCDYVCEDGDCDIADDDGDKCDGECTYACQNCIFDGQSNTFFYRTVSINSLFPNSGRDRGPNWNSIKGEYTLKQIEEAGENAYRDPEYSYEINPVQMNRIRQFNRDVGNYLNTLMDDKTTEALHCESYNTSYANIVCKSTFLDTTGNKYFTELARNEEWTLWPNSGYYQSPTKYVFENGLGPAWR